MPVHDYLCEACGRTFEHLTLPGDDAVACAACESQRVVRQVVSRIAVRGANQRRGRVIDMSSGACPCHGRGHRHS